MKLTNQHIENAFLALQEFNPPKLRYKTKIRLARNLRKLTIVYQEKENDRVRLAHSHMKDQSKKPDQGAVSLTPEEYVTFQPEYYKLMNEEVEVEIHPIELYSGNEEQIPTDLAHSIDIDEVKISSSILSALIDVVFVVND